MKTQRPNPPRRTVSFTRLRAWSSQNRLFLQAVGSRGRSEPLFPNQACLWGSYFPESNWSRLRGGAVPTEPWEPCRRFPQVPPGASQVHPASLGPESTDLRHTTHLRHTTDCRVRLLNRNPTTRLAPNRYKSSILRQDLHPTAIRVACISHKNA